jgi:MFS family permease
MSRGITEPRQRDEAPVAALPGHGSTRLKDEGEISTAATAALDDGSSTKAMDVDRDEDEDDDEDDSTLRPTTDSDPEQLSRVSSGPAYSTFSKPMKRWIITMVTFSSFVSPMTANIYFPALNPIAADLGVSVGLINLSLTTYMIFQGLAPTIFGDFGDMAGRRPAFIIAFTIYFVANVGLALQTNYAALLVLRMMQSGGSSGTLALGYAVVADLTVSAERGKFMGIVGAGINVGPAISPALGGILAQFLGWRAIFWFCAIFTGVWMVPYVLSVPETCRKVVGNGSVAPQGWNMTLLDYIRFRRHPPAKDAPMPPRPRIKVPNPLHTLLVVFDRLLGLVIFYNMTLYLIFILVCATLSTQFKAIYHYSDLVIGLCYLPYGIGCMTAALGQGYLLDWNYRRIARRIGFSINYRKGDDLSHFPIEEARIQPIYAITAVGLLATVAYGWVLAYETSVAIPLVLLFIIGLCVTGSFSILNTLLVDLSPAAPATAVAANNLVRCVFGAASTAAVESMLRAMGRGGTFTFLAGVVLFCSPILPVLVRYGPKWREERRLKETKQREEKEARGTNTP